MNKDSVNNGSSSKDDRLSSLQFEDGDLVVKLSSDSRDWLVMHTKVLAAASPFFAIWFKPQWGKHRDVRHPVTGDIVRVITKALKFVDDETYVLEGEEYCPSDHPLEQKNGFLHSGLSSRDWPRHIYDIFQISRTALSIDASVAHRVLFAMLYGLPVTVEAIWNLLELEPPGINPFPDFHYAVECLSNVCAYAEYYDCISTIRACVMKTMESFEHFGQAISDDPSSYAIIGANMRWGSLYFDAVRHSLLETARSPWPNWSGFEQRHLMPADSAKAAFDATAEHVACRDQELEDSLVRLSLTKTFANAHRTQKPYDVFTTLVQTRELTKEPLSEAAQAWQVATAIATQTYGQWVITHLKSQWLWVASNGSRREGSPSTLTTTCRLLREAAGWENPWSLFGRGASRDLAGMYKLDNSEKSAWMIRKELNRLVRDAVDIIHDYDSFPTKELHSSHAKKKLTVRLCMWNDITMLGSKAYVAVDEEAIPWEHEAGWPRPPDIPQMNMTEASAEWLEVLGEGEQEDGDTGGEDVKDEHGKSVENIFEGLRLDGGRGDGAKEDDSAKRVGAKDGYLGNSKVGNCDDGA